MIYSLNPEDYVPLRPNTLTSKRLLVDHRKPEKNFEVQLISLSVENHAPSFDIRRDAVLVGAQLSSVHPSDDGSKPSLPPPSCDVHSKRHDFFFMSWVTLDVVL